MPSETSTSLSGNEVERHRMIRQPYRITMARWEHKVLQKRVLTRIVSALQNEIALLEKGADPRNIPLFAGGGEHIPLKIPVSEFARDGNNHRLVHEAIRGLCEVPGGILLPEIKGASNGRIPSVLLPGFISKVETVRHGREVTLWIHRNTMAELVNPFNGLTMFSESVMVGTDNRYTQRIYELISHWKDKEVLTMGVDRLREFLSLGVRYATPNRLVFKVLGPVQKELAESADTFFHMSLSRNGYRVTHVNFAIETRLSQRRQQEYLASIREQVVNILRMRFGFREEHFRQVRDLLGEDSMIKQVNEKVGELWSILDRRGAEIANIPAWTLEVLFRLRGAAKAERTAAV